MRNIAAIAESVSRRQPILLLTGAGISTASGIPAYRDKLGRWSHPAPIQARAFYREPHTRQRYWARSMAGWPRMSGARPNPAHSACASLQALGLVSAIITQNVDGLHQRAGSTDVTDLHGNLSRVRCIDCDATEHREDLQHRLAQLNPGFRPAIAPAGPDGDSAIVGDAMDFQVPECLACGGIIKPDVVFFGENVPTTRVQHCFELLENSGLLLCIGTSLMVYSGYRFCQAAAQQCKPIAIVNQGKTRADDLASHKVEIDCAIALDELVQQLCKIHTS